ncbi:MAG: hypothetical protein IPI83_07765 [Sphingomonadales bacterium]|nr:hypothetical protein [Sphingomonadales bacterium]
MLAFEGQEDRFETRRHPDGMHWASHGQFMAGFGAFVEGDALATAQSGSPAQEAGLKP